MVADTILRFWWIVGLMHFKFAGSVKFLESLELLTFVSMMMSAIRRTIWAIIRVENEFFNNYEEFRDHIAIPPVREDDNDFNEDG